MLSRRSVRIKVMQSLFVLESNEFSSPEKVTKQLNQSIDQFFSFYHYVLYTALEVSQYVQKAADIKAAKLLPTDDDNEVNAKLLENQFVTELQENETFQTIVKKFKFTHLKDEHVIQTLYKELENSAFYSAYLSQQLTDSSDDIAIIKSLVFEILLPNEVFVEHLGDLFLNRDDDGLDVERLLTKLFSKAKKKRNVSLLIFENKEKVKELKTFGSQLLKKNIENKDYLREEFSQYLKNWDASRLAKIDMLLIQMALSEMLYFKEIPTKVSINEYIDISKEYSTPKSKEFINGVLDKIMKNFKESGKIVKTGRGLLN